MTEPLWEETFHKPTFDNISAEKRAKILSVAAEEFATQGFENANINTIAKKAMVSVGSLYKYFDTKSDLFLTCAEHEISQLKELLETVSQADEDIMLKFEKLLRAAIRFSRENALINKLYHEFTTDSNFGLGKQLAQRMESLTAKVYKEAIVQGQVAGEIRADIDPGMAAFLIDNIFMSMQFSFACSYYRERFRIYAGNDIFEKEEFVIENILRFVKAALKPQKYPERKDLL